jgi:hypothetical protein
VSPHFFVGPIWLGIVNSVGLEDGLLDGSLVDSKLGLVVGFSKI